MLKRSVCCWTSFQRGPAPIWCEYCAMDRHHLKPDLARSFECDFCRSQSEPRIPLPAQTNRLHEFNHQIGFSVWCPFPVSAYGAFLKRLNWFAQVLNKVIEEHQPASKDEWLSCVSHAHVKNPLIQVHGYALHQFVFGRNPHRRFVE